MLSNIVHFQRKVGQISNRRSYHVNSKIPITSHGIPRYYSNSHQRQPYLCHEIKKKYTTSTQGTKSKPDNPNEDDYFQEEKRKSSETGQQQQQQQQQQYEYGPQFERLAPGAGFFDRWRHLYRVYIGQEEEYQQTKKIYEVDRILRKENKDLRKLERRIGFRKFASMIEPVTSRVVGAFLRIPQSGLGNLLETVSYYSHKLRKHSKPGLDTERFSGHLTLENIETQFRQAETSSKVKRNKPYIFESFFEVEDAEIDEMLRQPGAREFFDWDRLRYVDATLRMEKFPYSVTNRTQIDLFRDREYNEEMKRMQFDMETAIVYVPLKAPKGFFGRLSKELEQYPKTDNVIMNNVTNFLLKFSKLGTIAMEEEELDLSKLKSEFLRRVLQNDPQFDLLLFRKYVGMNLVTFIQNYLEMNMESLQTFCSKKLIRKLRKLYDKRDKAWTFKLQTISQFVLLAARVTAEDDRAVISYGGNFKIFRKKISKRVMDQLNEERLRQKQQYESSLGGTTDTQDLNNTTATSSNDSHDTKKASEDDDADEEKQKKEEDGSSPKKERMVGRSSQMFTIHYALNEGRHRSWEVYDFDTTESMSLGGGKDTASTKDSSEKPYDDGGETQKQSNEQEEEEEEEQDSKHDATGKDDTSKK